MEAEQVNHYFEHGEVLPETARQAKLARNDTTIERPARKISMQSGVEPQTLPGTEGETQTGSGEVETQAQETEPPSEPKA